MEDDKLKKILSEMVVPPASIAAREAAVSAALEGFDKKSKKTTQGNGLGSRLIGIINQLDRKLNMKKAYYYGGSLTAIALVIGVMVSGGPDQNEWVKPDVKQPAEQTAQPLTTETEKQAVVTPVLPAITEEPAVVVTNKLKKEPNPAKIAPTDSSAAQPLTSDKEGEAVQDAAGAVQAPVLAAPPPPAQEMRQDYGGNYKKDSLQSMNRLAGAKPMKAEAFAPGYMPPQIDSIAIQQPENRDKFQKAGTNPVKLVKEEPVSTFSIDVDTASYSFIRGQLNMGQLPQRDAVRVEEMINYFDYNYPVPSSKSQPFKPSVTIAPSPWNSNNKIVHIGIKGFDIEPASKPHSNLVFLIDTSGSMNEPNKLPLLINSFAMLLDTLGKDDTVSIVTYAGSAGTALEPTKASEKAKILGALRNLSAGGSTAGAAGIEQAYNLAQQNFDKEGVNRVILATDGDFNVGISDPEQLKEYIEKKRDTGIFLSVLGFGQGNYQDELMQKLAQNGNGNAAYIDSINEARKVLVEEASSTLFTIAKDVKIQVEFNKDTVSEYRLVGYETRMLNREDFNNDKVDAGEIGSGHAVTAIYEITPKGSKGLVDELRYSTAPVVASNSSSEYGFLKIRYKLPKESTSKLLTTPIVPAQEVSDISKASSDVRFASAVAAFGQKLHGDQYIGNFSFDDIIALAERSKGADKFGYRAEFINLVKSAKAASSVSQPQPVMIEE